MQVLSLGGGVQSTTLFLMNLTGEIDPPANFAVFADTGWERQGTYEDVEWKNLSPSEWEDACQFDEAIRHKHQHRSGDRANLLYLHPSLKPLSSIRTTTGAEEKVWQDDECQGGCWT